MIPVKLLRNVVRYVTIVFINIIKTYTFFTSTIKIENLK